MSIALQVKTTVLPGHRIEIQAAELPIGQRATVFIVLDQEQLPQRPLREVLGESPGGQLCRSAEDEAARLREEPASRDSCDLKTEEPSASEAETKADYPVASDLYEPVEHWWTPDRARVLQTLKEYSEATHADG
jgi:hypothetical protein